MHREGFISAGNEQLHYIKIGNGKKLLLAFHGYGNTAHMFLPVEKYLGEVFTILCIDLPHHGGSQWQEPRELTKAHLAALVRQLQEEFQIEKISLMGYSMGGRICLKLIELMPESIEQVLLIASDGLVFNRFYYFVTKTMIGKKLFRHFLTKHQSYAPSVNWLQKRNIVDPARYKYFRNYLESESARSFLLKVWPAMRQLVPAGSQLRKTIGKYHIPVYIFMGARDRVIPAAHARQFKKGLDSVQLFILDKGHWVMDAESLPMMAKCLITGTC